MSFEFDGTLESMGFRGFATVEELIHKTSRERPPGSKGVYIVLYPGKEAEPEFSTRGENGFDGGHPRPTMDDLKSEWIRDTRVVYIGQTGGNVNGKPTNGTLNRRICQYIRYGRRGEGNHGGGRYIWYLSRARELVFCWKPLGDSDEDPKDLECRMLRAFMCSHEKRLPFANQRFDCPE